MQDKRLISKQDSYTKGPTKFKAFPFNNSKPIQGPSFFTVLLVLEKDSVNWKIWSICCCNIL